MSNKLSIEEQLKLAEQEYYEALNSFHEAVVKAIDGIDQSQQRVLKTLTELAEDIKNDK